MISKDNFTKYCINQIDYWFKDFYKRKYLNCNNIAAKHIDLCRGILNKNLWDTEEENNVAFMTGTLFKGLTECIQLAELTRDRKWHLDNKRTEEIWGLLCNCFDRFEFCSSYFKADDFTWVKENLRKLRDDFVVHFGHGMYSSPEILFKKEICSVCNKDTRACLHIGGNLYNGVMCYSIPQKIELRSVSLVTIPRDPRCRLWSWNMTENMTFTTSIMVFFRIDDWLVDKDKKS